MATLPSPVNVQAPRFQDLTPEELQALLSQGMGYADQLVQTGPALQTALANRTKAMAGGIAERYNARGQGMGSGVFKDALANALATTGAEAELGQQRELTNMGANMFNTGRGEVYGGRQAEYGGDLQSALTNATTQNDFNLAQYATQAEAEAAKKRKKAARMSGVMGALGGTAGLLLGGPLGAVAGQNVGSGIGEAL